MAAPKKHPAERSRSSTGTRCCYSPGPLITVDWAT